MWEDGQIVSHNIGAKKMQKNNMTSSDLNATERDDWPDRVQWFTCYRERWLTR